MTAPRFSGLSRLDLILLLELIDQSLAAETCDDIRNLLGRICSHVPTDGMITILSLPGVINRLARRTVRRERESNARSLLARMLAQATRPGALSTLQSDPLVINVGLPTEWLEHYTRNNYFASDPNKRQLLEGADFLRWSESFSSVTLPIEKEYVRHAREYEMGEGITVACRQPRSGLLSLFCFRGRELERTDRDRVVLRHVAPYLHEAMRRVNMQAAPGPVAEDQYVLSNREKEVLRWAMDGKTNWEISMILDIGERTVKFHVQNAMRKLDASSRSQAVAIAVRRRLISY